MTPIMLPADWREWNPPPPFRPGGGMPITLRSGVFQGSSAFPNVSGEIPHQGGAETFGLTDAPGDGDHNLEDTVSISPEGFNALLDSFAAAWPTLKPRRRTLLFQRGVLIYLQWVLGTTAAMESEEQIQPMLAFVLETARASGRLP